VSERSPESAAKRAARLERGNAALDTTWIDHTERSTDPSSDHAAPIAGFFLTDPDDGRM
jgi:hypothetical protein